MATQDELNTSAIAVVGFLGAIILFAVLVILMIVFFQVEAREQYAKDTSQAYGQVSKLTADQQGRLASYGWVNEESGVAYIPVKRAMDLVAAELSRDPHADVTGVPPQAVQPSESTSERAADRQVDAASPDQAEAANEDVPPDAEKPSESNPSPDDAKEEEDAP